MNVLIVKFLFKIVIFIFWVCSYCIKLQSLECLDLIYDCLVLINVGIVVFARVVLNLGV